MSKFATKAKSASVVRTKTVNAEGHIAYEKTATEELYSALVASFLNGDKYYKSEEETMRRISELVDELVASGRERFLVGLTYLTRKLGNRTSFHLASALVGQKVQNSPRAVKNLFKFGCERPDDLIEIAAAWAHYFGKVEKRPLKSKHDKTVRGGGQDYSSPSLRGLPRRIREGLAKAFEKFDAYQLAKYKGTKNIKLRDLVCVLRPKSSECKAGAEAIKQLLNGTLTAQTWESELSKAGQEKVQPKEVWEKLLKEDKVGYMALLRNVRNLVEAGVDQSLWLPKLTDEQKVLNSKQFPFRFLSAYKAVENCGDKNVLRAIEKAIKVSCRNIPEMTGKTVIAVDLSGSMDSKVSTKSTLSMKEIGSNFASMLYERSGEVIVYGFGDDYARVKLSPNSGVLDNAQSILRTNVGYSTNGYLVIKDMINGKVNADRVVFFTDCVLWDNRQPAYQSYQPAYRSSSSVHSAIVDYWKAVNPKTHFWFVDLTGYKTTVDPGDERIHLIAGFNENMLKMIAAGESKQSNISDDIVRLCESICDQLAVGEFPGKARELFEDLV